MSGRDIIVVGASAGGVEALIQLVQNLPTDLPCALFIVLHIPAQGTSLLPTILNRVIQRRHKTTFLQAIHPNDGEPIEHGRIYIAPPNHHLLVKKDYVHLARGPKENSHRPAVDPLFRTAARAYRSRVVGVVLSGTLDDGTAGLVAVKQQGGIAIAQDPQEALYSGMPSSAIENVEVDYILRVADMIPVLVELAHQSLVEQEVLVPSDLEIESDIAELELEAMQILERPGTPSPFACPDCNGVLWEIKDGDLIRFRCRTGHAYSTGSLIAAQSEALEEALWIALRALEEKAALAMRLVKRTQERNQPLSAARFENQSHDAQQRASVVRKLLLKGEDNVSTVNGKSLKDVEKNDLGITVKDTGIGIAEADIGHIFEEFRQLNQTLTRQHGGTGLGLTITHRLVSAMGGKITVESQLLQGSTFRVELPRQVQD